MVRAAIRVDFVPHVETQTDGADAPFESATRVVSQADPEPAADSGEIGIRVIDESSRHTLQLQHDPGQLPQAWPQSRTILRTARLIRVS
jgi:hypothetical protein